MIKVMLYDLRLGLKTSVTSAFVFLELSLKFTNHVRSPATLPEDRLHGERPESV